MPEAADTRIPLCVPVIGDAERAYVAEAMASGWVAFGSYLPRFEAALCEATGSPHAFAIVNGTSALHISLLLAGVRPGDAVVVPTVTFVASVNAIRYTGAEPIFMDCDEYLGLDVEKLETFLAEECDAADPVPVHRATGRPVRAIMPVHVFGNPCDTAAILASAKTRSVAVVEDAAEALGSRYTAGLLAGTAAGTSAPLGALSFNANKLVTCGGGGAILARDAASVERAAYLSAQAKDDGLRSVHNEVGYNYRLSNLHAAIGLAQVERLAELLAHRTRMLARYRELLDGVPGLGWIEDRPGTAPNHWFFGLVVSDEFGATRDDVMDELFAGSIECRPLWRCNHLQKPFSHCSAYRIERAPHYESTVLNVPCSADLTDEDVTRVCGAVLRARR